MPRFVPRFISEFSKAKDDADGPTRAWYLDAATSNNDTVDGFIRYGSSGFESKIVDSRSLEEKYDRKTTDMEVIPLYFRMWIPSSGPYGLVALQTFGQRSCVNRFYDGFFQGYRRFNEGYRITFDPVAPVQLSSYRHGQVKKISFFKHDHASDSSENAVLPAGNLVDYRVTLQARPKEHLGLLQGLKERFASRADDKHIQYGDTDFDEATAEVLVGKKRRRVTLFGMSRETGKFDLTEDVTRGPNGMPLLESIRAETSAIFDDIVSG